MKTVGLVLTLALVVGCSAMQMPYAAPHRSIEISKMAARPTSDLNTLAASEGRILWATPSEKMTRFLLLVDGQRLLVEFSGTHPDVYEGGAVAVLYTPVRAVDGINAFGGPATALYVHAWAINGVNGTLYEPGRQDITEKWRTGTLFAAR